jgi:hypothetical protein
LQRHFVVVSSATHSQYHLAVADGLRTLLADYRATIEAIKNQKSAIENIQLIYGQS